MAIKIKLEGFDELLEEIEKAAGSADRGAAAAVSSSAAIMDKTLRAEMNAVAESDLAQRMPHFTVENDNGNYSASVGFPATPYNPRDLSDYHKAIFLNYGTPNRTKHGKEEARGFITKAKRKARPQIKKAQKEALEKVIERLKK